VCCSVWLCSVCVLLLLTFSCGTLLRPRTFEDDVDEGRPVVRGGVGVVGEAI
jgi:hypothetical protein